MRSRTVLHLLPNRVIPNQHGPPVITGGVGRSALRPLEHHEVVDVRLGADAHLLPLALVRRGQGVHRALQLLLDFAERARARLVCDHAAERTGKEAEGAVAGRCVPGTLTR